MKTASFYKVMQTTMRSLIGAAAIFAAIFAAAASADKEEAKPVVISGPEIVDWTPGSNWQKKLAQEGRKVDPSAKVAPPAFGRDKMKVKAKLLERGSLGVKPPSAPPQSPSTAKK